MKVPSRFSFPAVPAVLLSILSTQGGAALAKGLLPAVGPAGTAGLRIGISALVLLVVARPRLSQLQARQWGAVVPYGLAMGLMNIFFYYSLERIPLGLAVTLEFVGPLTLALVSARRWYELAWAVLAGLGIALLAPWHGQSGDVVGMGFALAAGACWAVYILLGKRTAALLSGQQGVAIGLLVAGLLVLPVGVANHSFLALTPYLLLLAGLLALFCSILPFTLELQALRVLPARTFSILISLSPVAAALSGWLFLGEKLAVEQWLAVGCIVVASVGATVRTRQSAPEATTDQAAGIEPQYSPPTSA